MKFLIMGIVGLMALPMYANESDCVSGLLKFYQNKGIQKSIATVKKACQDRDSSCVLGVAAVHLNWSGHALNQSCRSKRPSCVSSLAKSRPEWNSSQLRKTCDDQRFLCIENLAKAQEDWGIGKLKEACIDVFSICPAEIASLQPSWGPYQVARVCTSQNMFKCSAGLVQVRPEFSSFQIERACEEIKTNCVVELANQQKALNSLTLNIACQKVPEKKVPYVLALSRVLKTGAAINKEALGPEAACLASLSLARPTWEFGELKMACDEISNDCPAGVAQNFHQWSPSKLNYACATSEVSLELDEFAKNITCAHALSTFRPGSTASFLREACEEADNFCVPQLGQVRPEWSAYSLKAACREANPTCVVGRAPFYSNARKLGRDCR